MLAILDDLCYSVERKSEADADKAHKAFDTNASAAQKKGTNDMAYYVMSDLHGEADRFHAMLEKIRFSREDVLYVLGDVVDRGPDGIGLLREIIGMPNAVMLLGNHEYMMHQYMSPDATEKDIRRWNRNGNAPTLASFLRLDAGEQRKLLSDLQTLPTHLKVKVNGKAFYLVHGFPGENVHDEVWNRPNLKTPNPIPDCRLIIGHTPVLELIENEFEQNQFAMEMEARGEHLRMTHTPGFIDIDCGCGYDIPIKALACIRLEDLAEFYV